MEWKHGKPITDRGLSNLLRGFKIRSDQFRYNEKKVRGYRKKDFLDAWERYLSGTDGTDLKNKGLLNNLSGTKSKSVPQKKTIASIKIRVYRLYRLEPPYLGEIGTIELAPISSGASPSIPVPVSDLRLSGQWSSFVSQVFLCTCAHYQFLQKY